MSHPFDPNQPPMAPGSYPAAPSGYTAPYPDAPAYGAPPPIGDSHAAPATPADLGFGELADFATRAAAWLLDWVFLGALGTLLLVPFGLLLVWQWETEPGTCRTGAGLEPCNVPTDAWMRMLFGLIGIYVVLAMALTFFYFVFRVSRRGQTFGGQLMGLRIVSLETGRPPRTGATFLRYLVRALIGQFFIGYLWMLFDPRRQTLHDKAAKTVVVRT
jgi:uncharacterized RDD family membrane protein YckC